MQISRRVLLGVGGVVVVGGAAGAWRLMNASQPSTTLAIAPASAATPDPAPVSSDPRMVDRAMGKADAPVTVAEYFSLTCPHCAAFHRESFPQIKTQLIDTGKLRMIFREFPLDQLALTAAMVARALPPERYEPFCAALFASQDRWAFARGINNTEELAKMAALAGMSRDTFNTTIADQGLKTAILKVQEQGDKTYHVDSTPSFIFNGPAVKNRRESGGKPFDEFAKIVSAAAG